MPLTKDGRTNGKWKIGQCSVRPETAILFLGHPVQIQRKFQNALFSKSLNIAKYFVLQSFFPMIITKLKNGLMLLVMLEAGQNDLGRCAMWAKIPL